MFNKYIRFYEYFNNDLIEMTEKKIIVDGHDIKYT